MDLGVAVRPEAAPAFGANRCYQPCSKEEHTPFQPVGKGKLPVLFPLTLTAGQVVLAVAIGAELLLVGDDPSVGPVFLGLNEDLLGIVASHAAGRNLALLIDNLRRGAIAARGPRLIGDMSVRFAVALGTTDIGFGVLYGQFLDHQVQVANLAATVVRHRSSSRAFRRRLVIEQQKRLVTGWLVRTGTAAGQ